MKILSTGAEVGRELVTLMERFSRFDWAVAWASCNSEAAKLLAEFPDRIGSLTVGLHFYQTHPEFLQQFYAHPKVRFILSPSGVFHPKVFLFSNENGEWAAVVGSANLTGAGLGKNDEVSVVFGSRSGAPDSTFEKLRSQLAAYWDDAASLTLDEVDAYRSMWKRQAPARDRLAGKYGASSGKRKRRKDNDGGKAPTETGILSQTWSQFYRTVKQDPHHTVEGRSEVLKTFRRWFHDHEHFSDMDELTRKRIAGISVEKDPEIDWLWFGSMKGAGYFKNAVIRNSQDISAALDAIPLSGRVSREDYAAFIERFQAAFDGKRGGGDKAVATATRLLAMKRPDCFVCVDSKNRAKLCSAFSVPQSLDVWGYWDSVCERIFDAAWWNSPEPDSGLEREVWRGRAAFLDALFYEPEA